MPARDTTPPDATGPASGSPTRRRLVAVLIAFGTLAAAGVGLRIACVGKSCEEPASAAADVPFCGLPPTVRQAIAGGFRDGRSPNVMAVAHGPVFGGTAFEEVAAPPWPATGDRTEVPVAFFGTGVADDAEIPDGTSLDQIAPTIAEIIGLEREHPEVRSGVSIEGIADGERPRLVVLIALEGTEPSRLQQTLGQFGAVSSASVSPGSEPIDPAAIATTIGTGGLPRQHGITGTLLRNDEGRLVEAWGRRSPISVIATLGDDLDEANDQASQIGLVAPDTSYQGLIGGNWYIDNDRDDISIVSDARAAGPAARQLLKRDYGRDDIPDLLAVVMSSDDDALAEQIAATHDAAMAASGDSALVVVAGLGPRTTTGTPADEIERALASALGTDAVEATAPGGLFIDQDVLAERNLSEDDILAAVSKIKDPDGSRLFSDVFTSIAVSFERYC